ncbi:MAG: ABC transporter ATP-binding protein [Nitrospirota bacterium]
MIRTEGLEMEFKVGFAMRRVKALKGLTMEVKRGEVFGFLGPNGAGKTTTIKILVGLAYATAGKAWLMGKELGDVRVKEGLGFLPEQPYFYDYLSAWEFLDFYGRLFGIPKKARKDKAVELLGLVGLSQSKDLQLRKFSKGMLQRIGIAQALINDPELVILDEPMSGLDPIGRKDVRDIIMGLKEKGKTVFFSTHILPDVEVICDRVGILVKGELRATGTVGELLGSMEARSMEMTTEGLGPEDLKELERLSRQMVIRDGQASMFFDDPDKAREARRLVCQRGGDIVSLIPHKGSLEDIFVEEVKKGGRP